MSRYKQILNGSEESVSAYVAVLAQDFPDPPPLA
jgi:hypothetical protein